MNISITDMSIDDIKTLISLAKTINLSDPCNKITGDIVNNDKITPDTNETHWMSLTDAAEILNRSKRTLLYHISNNKNIPSKLMHGKRYVDVDVLKSYVDARGHKYPNERNAKKEVIETDYKKWHDELIAELEQNGFSRDTDYNKLMSKTYEYMTKNYGIIWEDIRNEYKAQEGKTVRATCLLAHWLECKQKCAYHLTLSCLHSVCEDMKGASETCFYS